MQLVPLRIRGNKDLNKSYFDYMPISIATVVITRQWSLAQAESGSALPRSLHSIGPLLDNPAIIKVLSSLPAADGLRLARVIIQSFGALTVMWHLDSS